MIQIHRVAAPETYGHYRYGTDAPERITKEEIEAALVGTEVREVWLWYLEGGYEGSGQMLMRGDNGWDVANLGHCSCNGPLDGLKFRPQTLEELQKGHSEEAWQDIAPLVLAATARVPE